MRGKSHNEILLNACLILTSLCLGAPEVHGQAILEVSTSPRPSETAPEIRALSDLIIDLQAQVRTLGSQLSELRAEQQRARDEARDLRRELDDVRSRPVLGDIAGNQYSKPVAENSAQQLSRLSADSASEQGTSEGRIAKLEENQEVIEGKVDDQYQTKIESGSKYRLRLSGMVLLNIFQNHGLVDNQDFPQVVESPQSDPLFVSSGTFGGSLRQSQLKLQAFGPDIAGARTSADIEFDFAGGFPDEQWNGVSMGLMRLRTGRIRLDWTNTSVVAGQDGLFFVPLAPTSIASLATPALSYSGNLWTWTPQVRVEHRIPLAESSNIVVQAGILDSLTGDEPAQGYGRSPSWGELSGQPAYATRIAWSHRLFGQQLTIGVGGYYSRQNWGFDRTVDGWAGTTDVLIPFGRKFEFTGAFYRGRAVAGLGGGIGQSVLLNGSFISPATTFWGLDSAGGWAQLKFRATPKLEINGAVGVENPFASELRLHKATSIYPEIYTRNLSPMLNFIYQIRSDILLSIEYRWLQTSVLGSGENSAGHISLNMGYIF
jgi:hypothetical protein